jgi:hypothetical protein
MSQIVQPRLITRAIVTADTGILAHASKCLFDELDRYATSPGQNKEGRVTTSWVASLFSARSLLRHDLIQLGSDRHHSRLVEFRVPDGEHRARQIHIRNG